MAKEEGVAAEPTVDAVEEVVLKVAVDVGKDFIMDYVAEIVGDVVIDIFVSIVVDIAGVDIDDVAVGVDESQNHPYQLGCIMAVAHLRSS